MKSPEDPLKTLLTRVEHIGIAVNTLDEGDQIYGKMLGVARYKIEDVPTERVRTAFYKVGDTKIELLEPTHPDSAISRFLTSRGPGMHHIAFEVQDIMIAMQRLKEAGFVFTRETPMAGADNKLVCFVHPKSAGGTLIELCQDMGTPQDRP